MPGVEVKRGEHLPVLINQILPDTHHYCVACTKEILQRDIDELQRLNRQLPAN